MGNRLRNRINSLRYRDRNKLFVNIREGDLVQIFAEHTSIFRCRAITRNNKNKFTYMDTNRSLRVEKCFNCGDIGMFLGRYDGGAVLLIGEALYHISISYIRKVKDENGNGS